MKKADNETLVKYATTFVLVLVLIIGTIGPIRRYIESLTFDAALAMNKAASTVNIQITALSPDGKRKIIPQYLTIADLDAKVAKGEIRTVMPFYSSVKKAVPATWISMQFKGFDRKGKPIYDYILIPEHFEVVVFSPDKGLVGSKIVSVIPDKPFITKSIRITMQKCAFKKQIGMHPFKSGKGYAVIDDYKTLSGKTRLAYVYSVPGEVTWLEFKRGSIAYIQSKYRVFSDRAPSGNWVDDGAVATPSETEFGIGYARNGNKFAIVSTIKYAYKREKTVIYTSTGTLTNYREVVYPVKLLDAYEDWTVSYIPDPPEKVTGESCTIGSLPGNGGAFPLKGMSVYKTPASTLNFTVSYGGESKKVSVPMLWQEHYAQDTAIHCKVLSKQQNRTLTAYDEGTNWGVVYFKWVRGN